jgi:hypothetical protein
MRLTAQSDPQDILFARMTQRHFADSSDLDFCGAAPTSSPVAAVRDVLLITTVGGGTFEEFQAHPPVEDEPIKLGRNVEITDLDPDVAELVMNSCTPRGHYFVAVRQFGTRNAFVRQISLPAYERSHYNWDHDTVLRKVLLVSRLVRDNAYSTEYAARVVEHLDGSRQVIPYIGPDSRSAWRIRQDRDWFDEGDALQLKELLKAYWKNESELPAPVHRALGLIEDSYGTPWLERTVPLTSAGLEAFLNTAPHTTGGQFKSRVRAVAKELGIPADKHFVARMWEMRSQAAHGQEIELFSAKPTKQVQQRQRHRRRTPSQQTLMKQVDRFREIAKANLRKAINDPAYARLVSSKAAVRRRWPVVDSKGKPI